MGSIEPDGTLKEAIQNTLRKIVRIILPRIKTDPWKNIFKNFSKQNFILIDIILANIKTVLVGVVLQIAYSQSFVTRGIVSVSGSKRCKV